MIILRLMGGLGNQMSQVAYSFALSQMYDETIYLDTISYVDYKIRPLSVDKLNLGNRFKILDFEDKCIKRMHFMQRLYAALHYRFGNNRQLGKLIYYFFSIFGHYYSFDSLYYGIPKSYRKNKDVYGYFLSEEYFRDYYNELVKIFDTQEEYITDQCMKYALMISRSQCPIAISIRLQDDYIKNATNNVCTKDYYLKAIDIVKDKYPNADFFVFADDIERAKELKLDISAIYFDNISDIEGMYLLKRCKHYIISNSSFAWWGAYLGQDPEKIVIAPEHWMNDDKDYSSKYYDGMILIGF